MWTNRKASPKTKLLQAYKIALNPPSLSSIAQEIAERRQLEEEDEEEDREASEEPVRTRSRGRKDNKSAAAPKKELPTKNASINKRKSRTSNATANSETKEKEHPLSSAPKLKTLRNKLQRGIRMHTYRVLSYCHCPFTCSCDVTGKGFKRASWRRAQNLFALLDIVFSVAFYWKRAPLSEELPDLSNHLGRFEALPRVGVVSNERNENQEVTVSHFED